MKRNRTQSLPTGRLRPGWLPTGWLQLLTGLGLVLGSCGDPNVPLTRPPNDEFRVSSPRPPRQDRTPTPRPSPTPRSTQASLGFITAQFLDVSWPDRRPLLDITAKFLQIPLPGSTPHRSPLRGQPGTQPGNRPGSVPSPGAPQDPSQDPFTIPPDFEIPSDPQALEQLRQQLEAIEQESGSSEAIEELRRQLDSVQ